MSFHYKKEKGTNCIQKRERLKEAPPNTPTHTRIQKDVPS
jgi:hypothetical protein